MNFEQDASSVLIVSSSEKLTSSLVNLLPAPVIFQFIKSKTSAPLSGCLQSAPMIML